MSKKRPVGRPPKKRTKAETYKIRYQVLKNIGYTAKEAHYFRSPKLDVSKLKELSKNDEYWTKYKEVSDAINMLENIILYEEVVENE